MVPGFEYGWSDMDIVWREIQFLYSEAWILKIVKPIIEQEPATSIFSGGSKRFLKKGRPLDPVKHVEIKLGVENRAKLIKLVCIVHGKKIPAEKEILDFELTVSHIKATISEVEKRLKIII